MGKMGRYEEGKVNAPLVSHRHESWELCHLHIDGSAIPSACSHSHVFRSVCMCVDIFLKGERSVIVNKAYMASHTQMHISMYEYISVCPDGSTIGSSCIGALCIQGKQNWTWFIYLCFTHTMSPDRDRKREKDPDSDLH